MIVEQFDRQTMAKMEVALDRTCARFPHGGKHNIRKHVAQSIVRCAKTGNGGLDALTDAGERALALLSQHGERGAKRQGMAIPPNWQSAALTVGSSAAKGIPIVAPPRTGKNSAIGRA